MARVFQRLLLLVCCLALLTPLRAQEQTTVSPGGTVAVPGVSAVPAPGTVPAPTPTVVPATPEPPVMPATSEPVPPTSPALSTTVTPAPAAPSAHVTPLSITFSHLDFSADLGLYQFYDNVTVTSADIRITADEATYNDRTRTVLARGSVSVTVGHYPTIFGNLLEFNVVTRVWHFDDFVSTYPAGFLGPPFIAPVFINGQQLSGTQRMVEAAHAHVTTCDLAHPHYEIISRRVDIYPGDKLIARSNDLYVLGHRIVHIPWIVLSLKQYQTSIMPTVGENTYEGYYARFLYQYVINPQNVGGVRFDLTSKLGVGVGVDHFYSDPGGNGEAFGYIRQSLHEYVLRLSQDQALPDHFHLNFRGDAREDSEFSPQPTTLTDINSTLTQQTAHTNFNFNVTRQLNQSTFGTDSLSSNMAFTATFPNWNVNNSLTYSSYRSTGEEVEAPAQQTLWDRVHFNDKIAPASAFDLYIDKQFSFASPTGGTPVVNTGTERVPELDLTSDQHDLHLNFLNVLPSKFTLGWGLFNAMPANKELNRFLFAWQPRLNTLTWDKTTFTGSGTFQQTVYGDPDTTAQYMYNANLMANTKFGMWNNAVQYSLQHSDGFPQFSFDVVYPNQSLSETLQYNQQGKLTAFLTTGFDLERNTWNDLTLRTNAQVGAHFQTAQSVGYDLQDAIWRDLVSQFRWVDNPYLNVNLNTQYSLDLGALSQVSTGVDWNVTPLWDVQWLGGYDGITQQFSYNQFLIKRDLHCWDISLYYSSEPQTIYLYLRLKALNTPLPSFGLGSGGQVLNGANFGGISPMSGIGGSSGMPGMPGMPGGP